MLQEHENVIGTAITMTTGNTITLDATSGIMTVGGVLTYDDVTNVDSIGIASLVLKLSVVV